MPCAPKRFRGFTSGSPKPSFARDSFSSRRFATKMTNNPAFPNPTPTLAALNAGIAELHSAQLAAASRAKGATTLRDEKRTVVVGLLQPTLCISTRSL